MGGTFINRFSSSFLNFFGNYSTVKEIEIRNTYIAVIYRLLQFFVITYIALYIVLIKRGYQDVEEPRGSSISKVKGVARVSIGNTNNANQALWDAAEYLIPPLENNAFFIATRKTVTYGQTLGYCPSALADRLFCNSTYNPCKQGMPTPNSFGFLTGNCVRNEEDMQKRVCQINAWCPEELSNSTDYKINIDDLQHFTVFIKTVVTFSNYNIKIRTVTKSTNFSCRFDHDTARRCPIFPIGYILRKLRSQDSKINLMDLYHQGGLIEIQQKWRCDFDFASEAKECFPTFTFNLLQSGSDELSPGINYRFAEKYNVNGVEYRKLTKVYGLRFVLSVRGKGRRFNIVNLFVAIGSGAGYMVIADMICEFLFTKFHKYREEYRKNKVKVCHLKRSAKNNDSTALTTIANQHLEDPLIPSYRLHETAV